MEYGVSVNSNIRITNIAINRQIKLPSPFLIADLKNYILVCDGSFAIRQITFKNISSFSVDFLWVMSTPNIFKDKYLRTYVHSSRNTDSFLKFTIFYILHSKNYIDLFGR